MSVDLPVFWRCEFREAVKQQEARSVIAGFEAMHRQTIPVVYVPRTYPVGKDGLSVSYSVIHNDRVIRL